jgi:hypothetical protein
MTNGTSPATSFTAFPLVLVSKTMPGFQRKTLVQVEALTAHALFQHAFHALRPGDQDVEFGQFLLGQGAPAHTQRRAFIEKPAAWASWMNANC